MKPTLAHKEQFVPIYQKLYEQYKADILTQLYPPGSQIDSINQIMVRHHVSRETAKLVLQKLAADGLVQKRAGKGSFVPDLGPREKVWGVIVPFFSAQIDSLISHIHEHATKMQRHVEHFVDYNNWQEEIRLVGTLINKRYEAIIVIPTLDETKTADFYRNLVNGGSVVTLLDHTMAGSYFTYAIQSYDLGVNRAVSHLLKNTKNNLAFLKNDVWAGKNMVQELMESTFRNAVENKAPSRSAITIDHINLISPEVLKQKNIDGIFCCDDLDAVRIIGRLQKWGYNIPKNISLISYGNTELAQYFTPKITSINCHNDMMVDRTIEIIKNHINGQDVRFSQYVIQPELIVRET